MVGIISVVIGDHFSGGVHFDGGDHFGGGTATLTLQPYTCGGSRSPGPPNPTTSQATQDSQMETTRGKDSADEISEDSPTA